MPAPDRVALRAGELARSVDVADGDPNDRRDLADREIRERDSAFGDIRGEESAGRLAKLSAGETTPFNGLAGGTRLL